MTHKAGSLHLWLDEPVLWVIAQPKDDGLLPEIQHLLGKGCWGHSSCEEVDEGAIAGCPQDSFEATVCAGNPSCRPAEPLAHPLVSATCSRLIMPTIWCSLVHAVLNAKGNTTGRAKGRQHKKPSKLQVQHTIKYVSYFSFAGIPPFGAALWPEPQRIVAEKTP